MKKHFTLVEMLTVIAIIGILAGILLPVLGRVKDSGRTTQALTEAKSIHLAIKSFQNDHKYLPSKDAAGNALNDIVYWGSDATGAVAPATPNNGNDVVVNAKKALHARYLNLFDTICYTDHEGHAGSPATSAANEFNKLHKKYLAPTSTYYDGGTTGGFRDPWGRPYIVYLDTNYDNRIEGISSAFGLPGNVLGDTVGVISLGRDIANGSTLNQLGANRVNFAASWN